MNKIFPNPDLSEETPVDTREENLNPPGRPDVEPRETLEFYVEREGRRYAGVHLLVDLYDGQNLNDTSHVETVLRNAAVAAGATVLSIDLHRFSPEGVSGVAILAESHISIHTWPKAGYAALDVFMCGDCNPHDSIVAFKQGFSTEDVRITEMLRGPVP